MENLLTNAIKYSPAGTEVTVSVEDLGQEAKLSVRDEGIGLTPEARSHLFERFFRSEEAAGKVNGLGLGLYISRSLVEAHGGRICGEPAPGRGSVFTVVLPYRIPSPASG